MYDNKYNNYYYIFDISYYSYNGMLIYIIFYISSFRKILHDLKVILVFHRKELKDKYTMTSQW